VATAYVYVARHHKRQSPPTAEPVSFQGVVQSATAAQIEVLVDKPTDDDNSGKNKKAPHGKWSVLVPPDTPIQVKGEATPDYLHAGLMVQFTVAQDGKEGTATVHELTIMTAAARKYAHKNSTASKPPVHAGGDSPASKAKSEVRTVVGQLGHLHDDKWSVITDSKTWHIELADDVKIKVAFTGSHFVKHGDKISVQGEMVHGKPGTCTASDIQVTLAEPLKGAKSAEKQHKAESGS
jgi:hypothetical protein